WRAEPRSLRASPATGTTCSWSRTSPAKASEPGGFMKPRPAGASPPSPMRRGPGSLASPDSACCTSSRSPPARPPESHSTPCSSAVTSAPARSSGSARSHPFKPPAPRRSPSRRKQMPPEPPAENAARRLSPEQVRQIRKTRGLSSDDVAQLSDQALSKVLRRLEYPDLAWQREAFRLLKSRDDQGVVPHETLPRALRQLDSARARSLATNQAKRRVAGVPVGSRVSPSSLVLETAGLDPNHTGWTPLGPGNIGGRTRALVIRPDSPDMMWAGTAGGGVWKTEDGGQSWQPVDDL